MNQKLIGKMTIKLSRKEIVIKTNKGDITVKAWVYNDLLAWHKEHSMWILTHVPTGYKITSYLGQYKHIRDITNDLKDIVDWSPSDPNVIADILYSCEVDYYSPGYEITKIMYRY